MVRTTISIFLGFILVFVEALIVLKTKQYSSFQFGSIQLFMFFWTLNFCYVYTILTHIQHWLMSRPKPSLQQTKK